jgi:hypothetical protein
MKERGGEKLSGLRETKGEERRADPAGNAARRGKEHKIKKRTQRRKRA